MAKKSLAYVNMRRAVLAAIREIPDGRVLEAARLGQSLNIPSRHIAYILSQLSPDEEDLVPWHRVIPARGDFGPPQAQKPRHLRQKQRLRGEGFVIEDDRRVVVSADDFWTPSYAHRDTIWADEE